MPAPPLVGSMAEQMTQVGGSMRDLAGIIRPLTNGERDRKRPCKGMDKGETLVPETHPVLKRRQSPRRERGGNGG